jgi:hypothetical protein
MLPVGVLVPPCTAHSPSSIGGFASSIVKDSEPFIDRIDTWSRAGCMGLASSTDAGYL